MRPDQVLVVTPGGVGTEVAQQSGVPCLRARLTAQNFREVLAPHLAAGDFLLNVAVGVSSTALIALCRQCDALYLDTCIEPWAGGYADPALPISMRSNHALREAALALRSPDRGGPTAVLTHGANPGLVSHLIKQALLDVATKTGTATDPCAQPPRSRDAWAGLAAALGVRVVHIAERDTQVGATRKAVGEFVNTWSVQAFADEACQPSELGWGSHERHFPADAARHGSGTQASIYLKRPGASTRVRTWTPLAGPLHAFLITHGEAISIADYFTLGDGEPPRYRPTVHYAYHPCDDAVLSLHEFAGNNWTLQARRRVLKDEITAGTDELGVLLMGHPHGAYWYGSRLSIAQARALCPHNSATSLQVTAAVMAGVVWAMKNPRRDVIEPDEMPFDEILSLCRPYLGDLVGAFSDWTPLQGRGRLYDEDLDRDDPWQFKNFRVT
jgi:homospermidine synthase